MTRPQDLERRQFLQYGGAAAASVATASLAGCPGSGDDGDGNGDGTTTDEGGDGTSPGTETETETETTRDVPEDFPITITQGAMPTGLDPHDHRETPTDTVMLHCYEGVITRNREGQIVDGLATEYERVEDGLVEFTIRDDVQFHSGSDLSPEDVAYSINRMVDPDVGFASPQSDQLAGVTGAEATGEGRTVEVSSDGYNPFVITAFGTYCDVVEQAWIEERERSTINQEMNGTGPFQFESYEEGVEVVLSRFDGYWDAPAWASEVTFSAAEESSTRVSQLLAGESDIVTNVPPQSISQVENNGDTRVAATPSTRIIYNGMRADVEPFSNQTFRQALNYAVDLESIVSNILEGFGDQTGQPTLEGFVGHNPDVDPYPYDPEEADRLVEESGHAGVEIELHAPQGRYLRDFEIAQAVVSFVDELENVSASVNQRQFGPLSGELTSGDITQHPDWYLIGWGEATFDGGLLMAATLSSDGTVSSFRNDQVDSMLEEANTQQPDQREQTLQELNSMLHDQAPWIFLNRQYSVYGAANRIDWEARRDERIDAYEMAPAE